MIRLLTNHAELNANLISTLESVKGDLQAMIDGNITTKTSEIVKYLDDVLSSTQAMETWYMRCDPSWNIERLKSIPGNDIFACGFIRNNPEGVYMTNEHKDDWLRWVAKKGTRGDDWAIYIYWAKVKGYHPSFHESENGVIPLEQIMRHGDKVTDKENIRKMVMADDAMMETYRY